MLDFLTASPSIGSYRCDPMTIDQIDAHPDRDRIWATVVALRKEVVAEIERINDEREEEGTHEEGYGKARDDLKAQLDDIGDDLSEAMAKRILEALA